jgi:hypothetical protein
VGDDADRRYQLREVRFLENVGFVRDVCDDDIVIGLGQNNVLRDGEQVRVQIVIRDSRPAENDSVLLFVQHNKSEGRRLFDRVAWR